MRRDRGASDLFGPVGWVFADVLLALALVFLAAQSGGALSSPAVTTDTTDTTSTEPTTTTVPEVPPGVDSEYVCFRILVDPGLLMGPASPARDQHLLTVEQQIAARLGEQGLADGKAGIVLSFGVASEPLVGRSRADRFNDDLLPRFPTFRRLDGKPVASRAFWDGAAPLAGEDGSIQVNVYPIIDDEHPPLPPPPLGTPDDRC